MNSDVSPSDAAPQQELSAALAARNFARCYELCQLRFRSAAFAVEQLAREAAPPALMQQYAAELNRAQLNLALMCLKLRKFGEALKHSQDVLAAEPANQKALYRCAKALLELGRPAEAAAKTLHLDSADPLSRALIEAVAAAQRREKALYTRMMRPSALAPPVGLFRALSQRLKKFAFTNVLVSLGRLGASLKMLAGRG